MGREGKSNDAKVNLIQTPLQKIALFRGGILIYGAIIFFLSLAVGINDQMPLHARLIADHQQKTYLSPPCLTHGWQELNFAGEPTTWAAIHKRAYRPDTICRNAGGLVGPYHSWLRRILLPSSRWNADGSWNW